MLDIFPTWFSTYPSRIMTMLFTILLFSICCLVLPPSQITICFGFLSTWLLLCIQTQHISSCIAKAMNLGKPNNGNLGQREQIETILVKICFLVPVNQIIFTLQDQLGRVALLSGFIFIMLGFGADGAPSLVQTRTPPPSVLGIPNIPCSTSGYSYTIMKLGPLQFTRKGLSVASTSASLSFAVCPPFDIQTIFW